MLSFSRPQLLRCITLATLAAVLFVDQAQSKVFPGDMRWRRRRDPQLEQPELSVDLAELLTLRDMDEDPLLEKAMNVIDSIATRSTCHQAATGQLLVTCKAAAGKDMAAGEGKHDLLERAKSVYAVRLSVCETGEGRAAIPAICKPILAIPRHLNREFEVVNSVSLPPCLEALMAEHYYWTSYSNSRQDANTLCQAVTLEASRLEALESYQRLAELLPSFRNDLLSTRSKWLAFVEQQEQSNRELGMMQKRNQEDALNSHRLEMKRFHSAMEVAKEGLSDASRLMQQSMASTSTGIDQSREAIAQVLTDFGNLRRLLSEAVISVDKTNTENAAKQATDMKAIHDLALVTSEVLRDTNVKDVMVGLNELVSHMKTEISDILDAQTTQSSNMQQHLRLSEEVTENQKTNLAWSIQLNGNAAHLASELDSATGLAGQMSHRLEHVSQALGRVEKASSTLNTIFALIAIPSRVLNFVHLRLLGMFALPTVILYFSKPWRYSCILMALYVFIESTTSLVGEHKAIILSAILRSVRWLQTASIFILHSLKPYRLLVAPILVYAIIRILKVEAFSKRKNLTAPPFMSRHALKSQELKRDIDIERLRSGKRWRSSPDRSRRAATVC